MREGIGDGADELATMVALVKRRIRSRFLD
jgi:hypothetical protein